jgi:hypothetical protein
MVAFHECAGVAALRAAHYVKPVLRPTMKMTLSLPPPFPATLLMKMLPQLKMMPKKTMPEAPIPAAPAVAADAKNTEKNTETKKAEPKIDTKTADDETKKPKTKKQVDNEDMEKKKKKTEEAPSPQDPDDDIGDSPIDYPGYPEDGTNFHPPPPSPIALHLQGPFPDG